MTNFFREYFDPNNTPENHKQFALFTACLTAGIAFGLYMKECPNAALVVLAIGMVLTTIKTAQANFASARNNLHDGAKQTIGMSV